MEKTHGFSRELVIHESRLHLERVAVGLDIGSHAHCAWSSPIYLLKHVVMLLDIGSHAHCAWSSPILSLVAERFALATIWKDYTPCNSSCLGGSHQP